MELPAVRLTIQQLWDSAVKERVGKVRMQAPLCATSSVSYRLVATWLPYGSSLHILREREREREGERVRERERG